MKKKILFWKVLFVIPSIPTMNYLSKVSNGSARIRCENCSRLRTKTQERCQWRRSNAYIVNCKHISIFFLFIDFEQANVFWIPIEKINTFEDKIRYIMRYVVVIYVWPKFINKKHLKLYHDNPTGESVRNFCEGVYFKRWFWLKRCGLQSKWAAGNLSFYRFCLLED